jgi:hypothetical protein
MLLRNEMTISKHGSVVLLTSVLLLGLLLVGCDSVLQEQPTSFVGPDNFYQSEDDAERALAGAYSLISQNAFGGYIGSYQWLRMTDKATAEMTGLGDHENLMEEWRWGPSTSERNVFVLTWNAAYEGVNAANAVINRVPDIPEMSEAAKRQMVAEARFIRGIHYYYLAGFWGNVPIKREETTSLTGLRRPNASEDSVYTFAINNLEEAIPNLPDDNDPGRATRTAAQTLLAKMYLQRASLNADNGLPAERQIAQSGDYQAALDLLNEVIQSNKYQLPTDVVEQYNDLFWEPQGGVNPEVIFSYQWDPAKGSYSGGLPSLIGSDTGGGVLASWHSNSVGQAAVTFYDNMVSSGDLRAQVTFLEEIPRLDQTPVVYSRADYENDGYKEDLPVFRKYAKAPTSNLEDNDYVILRYADVLLMKAEAVNEINDGPTTEAYGPLNQIRQRAGLGSVSGLSYEEFREEVYTQRRRELILEGHGWHTLQRFWDIGTQKVRDCAEIDSQFPPSTKFCPQLDRLEIDDPKDRLYPIPTAAISRNPQLTQNPGY